MVSTVPTFASKVSTSKPVPIFQSNSKTSWIASRHPRLPAVGKRLTGQKVLFKKGFVTGKVLLEGRASFIAPLNSSDVDVWHHALSIKGPKRALLSRMFYSMYDVWVIMWYWWYIKLIQRLAALLLSFYQQHYSLVWGLMRFQLGWP